jgi:hypothetical protein
MKTMASLKPFLDLATFSASWIKSRSSLIWCEPGNSAIDHMRLSSILVQRRVSGHLGGKIQHR